jgi:hypothetical protein
MARCSSRVTPSATAKASDFTCQATLPCQQLPIEFRVPASQALQELVRQSRRACGAAFLFRQTPWEAMIDLALAGSHKNWKESVVDETTRWDVAVSFASKDEAVAIALREALEPAYRVFVYSKAQEHLAGRDGIEAFRPVFRERANLIVVLFGSPWGETPFTKVEKIAIEEFVLESGWEHLLFVRLNSSDAIPKWVPRPHLHLDLVRFAMPDLVGAIKLRLAELGTEARVPTSAERAVAQEKRRQFDAETVDLLCRPGTFETVANELIEAIGAQAAAVAQSGWRVGSGQSTLHGYAVVAWGQSLRVVSMRRYLNSLDDCYLHVLEYDGALTIAKPGQRYRAIDEPRPSRTHKVAPRRLPGLGWCWKVGERVLPPSAAAAEIMQLLLDRIEAAHQRQ